LAASHDAEGSGDGPDERTPLMRRHANNAPPAPEAAKSKPWHKILGALRRFENHATGKVLDADSPGLNTSVGGTAGLVNSLLPGKSGPSHALHAS